MQKTRIVYPKSLILTTCHLVSIMHKSGSCFIYQSVNKDANEMNRQMQISDFIVVRDDAKYRNSFRPMHYLYWKNLIRCDKCCLWPLITVVFQDDY